MNTVQAQVFLRETSLALSRYERALAVGQVNASMYALQFCRYLLWSGLLSQFKCSEETNWITAPTDKRDLARQVDLITSKCLKLLEEDTQISRGVVTHAITTTHNGLRESSQTKTRD